MSDVVKSKPQWMSKTNWGVIAAVVIFACSYFGADPAMIESLCEQIGVTPTVLSATFIALLNVALKVATWAYYKWIKKD